MISIPIIQTTGATEPRWHAIRQPPNGLKIEMGEVRGGRRAANEVAAEHFEVLPDTSTVATDAVFVALTDMWLQL